MKSKKTDRPKPKGNSGGLLPPPPGGVRISAPPKPQTPVIAPPAQQHVSPVTPVQNTATNQNAASNLDLLGGFGMPSSQPITQPQNTASADLWGGFASNTKYV